jgi:hypothetical protein
LPAAALARLPLTSPLSSSLLSLLSLLLLLEEEEDEDEDEEVPQPGSPEALIPSASAARSGRAPLSASSHFTLSFGRPRRAWRQTAGKFAVPQ